MEIRTLNFEAIEPILKANDVEFAAVFGSYARGDERADSDLNLLVRFKEPKSFFELGRLEDELAEILDKKIDLVTEKALSPYIRNSVLQNMKTVYEKS